tara:strand:- start:59 stop:547 length:489 start_codon:yes stop_codon:yes gene_type:complete
MVVNSAGQWMAAAAGAAALAVPLGLAMGQYATHAPVSAPRAVDENPALVDAAAAALTSEDAGLKGPGVVRCTGCAPTLAERQAAADMAGMDLDGVIGGSSDPVVVDYQRQDLSWDDGNDPQEQWASPIHRLPDNVDRFARGEAVGRMGGGPEGERMAAAFQP